MFASYRCACGAPFATTAAFESARGDQLREFRTANRFSRPNADATLAIAGLAEERVSAEDALQALRADLLDTYQARLTAALHDLAEAAAGVCRTHGWSTRR